MASALQFLGWILTVVGGIAVGALFFYGVYVLLVDSWLVGLAIIGASVIATFFLNVLRGIAFVGADASAKRVLGQLEANVAPSRPLLRLVADAPAEIRRELEQLLMSTAETTAAFRSVGTSREDAYEAVLRAAPPGMGKEVKRRLIQVVDHVYCLADNDDELRALTEKGLCRMR